MTKTGMTGKVPARSFANAPPGARLTALARPPAGRVPY
jgi:hypothetical protein